jgi:hypothetical protein
MDGILFIALGDQHVEEAGHAVERVREHMPDVEITVLGAGDFPVVGPQEFAALLGVENPPERQRAFYNKIVALEHTPYARTLFFDGDTRLAAPMYELFTVLDSFPIAAALTPTRVWTTDRQVPFYLPAHNTGLLAYRRERGFFKDWRKLFVEQYDARDPDHSDQSVFDRLLVKTRIGHASLPEEYNYRVSALAKVHGPVKLFHGRDHKKLAATEQFVNRVELERLVLPEVGMTWLDGDHYWFSSYDDPEPVPLRRQQYLMRLSRLL